MKLWAPIIEAVWPRPRALSDEENDAQKAVDHSLDARIKALTTNVDSPALLEAARVIATEEDGRKAGAETRATTFIAAVATLIPLLTWALGNSDESICTAGWGCGLWAGTFMLSVLYFLTAAYWSLQSLAVANYHVIGVQDVVTVRESGAPFNEALIKQSLLASRNNQDTINLKITYIKVAQRRFFNGLVVMGFLLMIDPVLRFGVIGELRSEWTKRTAPKSQVQIQTPPVVNKPVTQ